MFVTVQPSDGSAILTGGTYRRGIQADDGFVDHCRRAPDRPHHIRRLADTWVSSRLWPPKAWSAYRCSVRTNNDVEGWHNRLNRKTRRGHLDIYQLASLLFSEAQFVDVQARLVSEARLCRRYQKNTYTRVQGRLASYWTQYESGQLSTSALLRKCCRVYGPVD